MKTFEDPLPVRPRKRWDTIEQHVEYLRHFAAYKSVLEVGCGTGYGVNFYPNLRLMLLQLTFQRGTLRTVILNIKKKN